MTRILALLTSPHTAGAVLSATACFTAQTGPATIELLHPRSDIDPDFLPTEEVYTASHRQRFEAEQNQLSATLQAEAAAWAKAGLPPLRETRGSPTSLAAKASEAADIVILGAPHNDPEARNMLEHMLFDAHKPVLLVPPVMPHGFGQNIAIAWSGSGERVGKIIAALPTLLLAARRSTILIGTDAAHAGTPPDDVLQTLQDAGKPPQIHRFSIAGRHIGTALLTEAHAVGADLLVMGAFSHSRLREFFFGGATVEILQLLDLPVLMQH